MSLSDEQVCANVLRGDVEAFAELVDRHERKVYGLALHLLRNRQDAADATQEAFVRCFTSLGKFDRERSFAAWLYRIAYNHCLDVLRQRKRGPQFQVSRHPDEAATFEIVDPGPGIEELAERGESALHLENALAEISEPHRQILVLRYTLDLSYAEMADLLLTSESTVTMRLYHAKRALRTVLQHQEHHVAP